MLGSDEVKPNAKAAVYKGGINKRRHIRVKPSVEHPIRVDINGENFIDVLHAKDISESGIGVRVPHFFTGCAIEKPVQFIISLPAPFKKTISARGVVKHTTDDQFGVYFTQIDRQSVRCLRDYITHRMAEDGDWFKSLAFKYGLIN